MFRLQRQVGKVGHADESSTVKVSRFVDDVPYCDVDETKHKSNVGPTSVRGQLVMMFESTVMSMIEEGREKFVPWQVLYRHWIEELLRRLLGHRSWSGLHGPMVSRVKPL